MNTEAVYTLLITQCVLLVFGIIAGFVKLTRDKKFLHTQTQARIQEMEERLSLSTSIEHVKAQLSEFYGPIHMLLLTNNSLFEKTISTDAWDHIRKQVLIPNNNRIAELLLNKIHLVDGDTLPPSFVAFIEHAHLWSVYVQEKGGFSAEYFEKQATFPHEFERDIRVGYAAVRQRFNAMIN